MIQHLLENANAVYVLHMRQQGVIRVRLGTAEYHQSQTWDKKESLKSDMGQHCVVRVIHWTTLCYLSLK